MYGTKQIQLKILKSKSKDLILSVLSLLGLFLSIPPIIRYLTAGNLKYKTAWEAEHLSSAVWRDCIKAVRSQMRKRLQRRIRKHAYPSLSELVECVGVTQSELELNSSNNKNNNIASIYDTWRRQRPMHDLSV